MTAKRYDAIVALQEESDELMQERDQAVQRAERAEQRLRDIEGIAEGACRRDSSG